MEKEVEKPRLKTKIVNGVLIGLVSFIILFSVGLPGYVMLTGKSQEVSVKPIETSLPDIAKQVMPGVVHVMCPQWQGSGFVVGPRLIATARHVVDGVQEFEITTNDGHKLKATRAISDKSHDVGFIYIDDLTCLNDKCVKDGLLRGEHKITLLTLELKSITECQLGQDVFAIGSPYGKINFNNLTSGIISGLNKNWEGIDPYSSEPYGWDVTWVTSVVGHPGNSGCPIFTKDGKVIGILVGGFSPVLICAMPADLFMTELPEIERFFVLDKYEIEKPKVNIIDDVYNCH